MGSKWRVDRMLALPRMIAQTDPHILHGWMYHGNVASRLAGGRARVPVVITSRRNQYIGGSFREWVKRRTAHLDNRVIAVSNTVRDAEIRNAGASPDRVVTIYNGIAQQETAIDRDKAASQLRAEFHLADEARVIVVVGRLHPQKGHEQLLKCFAAIRADDPSPYLLIVGDGPLREVLNRHAHNLDVAPYVIFAGNRQSPMELVAGADVFVLPSLWEGMPNAILEAMLVGTPVVATHVGGVSELLDETSGLVVPPGDIDALTHAVKQVLTDRTLADSLSVHAQERVAQHFTIARTQQQIEQIYDELLLQILRLRFGDGKWSIS
jgi:glycosyltransferase involved in cell wall biosynthesis